MRLVVRFTIDENEIGIFYLSKEEQRIVEGFINRFLENTFSDSPKSVFLRALVETDANIKWKPIDSDVLKMWYNAIKTYDLKIVVGSGGMKLTNLLEDQGFPLSPLLYAPVKRVRDNQGNYLSLMNTLTGKEYCGELYSLGDGGMTEKMYGKNLALVDDVIYSGRTMETVASYLNVQENRLAAFAILNITNSPKNLNIPVFSVYDVAESNNSYSYLAFDIIHKFML